MKKLLLFSIILIGALSCSAMNPCDLLKKKTFDNASATEYETAKEYMVNYVITLGMLAGSDKVSFLTNWLIVNPIADKAQQAMLKKPINNPTLAQGLAEAFPEIYPSKTVESDFLAKHMASFEECVKCLDYLRSLKTVADYEKQSATTDGEL